MNTGNKQFSVESIAFCNDDKYVVFAGTENNLQVFDLSNLSTRMKIPLGTVFYFSNLYFRRVLPKFYQVN
jgi:hypothetical protein